MWTLTVTLIATIAAALIILLLISSVVKKRRYLAHEKLDQKYTYRKEPHADQVTEKPNQLDDNPVTKG
jgi:hypothetical protein